MRLRRIASSIVFGLAALVPSTAPAQIADPIPAPINPSPISVVLQKVATGLSAPNRVAVAHDGSNRLFIVDQTGTVRLVKNGQLQMTPFLDVSSDIVIRSGFDERGLLGLAFHPGYNDPNSNGFRKLYTYTSHPVSGAADFTFPNPDPNNPAPDHQSVITEWQVSLSNPDMVDPSTRREIMRIDQPQFNHNGGTIAFGPDDNLYIALGDGGGANDRGRNNSGFGHTPGVGNGQDTTNIYGSIVRIDPINPALTSGSPDPVSANGNYRIPGDNPFVGPGADVDEIFAYGLRNPFSFSFDSLTGDLLAGDAGQGNIEEVDRIIRGGNFGWNLKEGSFLFNSDTQEVSLDPSPDPNLINPVLEYDHDEGTAVIGGFVYRGSAIPSLFGRYIFGDFGLNGTGRLFEADLQTGLIRELLVGLAPGQFVKGFGEDEFGELYVSISGAGTTGTDGMVFRLAVPEPSSLVLAALGGSAMLGLGVRNHLRRRRKGHPTVA